MLCKVLIDKPLVGPTPSAARVSRTPAVHARRAPSVKVEECARLPCGDSAVVLQPNPRPSWFPCISTGVGLRLKSRSADEVEEHCCVARGRPQPSGPPISK